MSGVRIYDLAKEIGVKNSDLIDVLRGLGEAAKSPSASVTEARADEVRTLYTQNSAAPIAAVATGTKASASKSTADSNGIHPPVSPAPVSRSADAAETAVSTNAAEIPRAHVRIPEVVSLRDFAELISVPASDIQKKLMQQEKRSQH